jgi:hypothetical protein
MNIAHRWMALIGLAFAARAVEEAAPLFPFVIRKATVPVEAAPGGAKIVIGPHAQTVWYEVVINK